MPFSEKLRGDEEHLLCAIDFDFSLEEGTEQTFTGHHPCARDAAGL